MPDVIVLNSHGVGQYAYVSNMPKWGETLIAKNWHVAEDGGKGTNVAVALGRLGIDTAYIGKVGNDPWGDLGDTWMTRAGVNTNYLYRTNEMSTGTGLILIGPNGENSIIDGDSSSIKLSYEEVKDAIDNLQPAKYFVTGFEIRPSLVLPAASYAKDKGMIVALNPSPIENEIDMDLSFVDYLFINQTEAEVLLGDKNKRKGLRDILKILIEKLGCKCIILTLGEKGNVCLNGDKYIENTAIKIEKVINTAGAGDGFMAATIAGLSKGKTLEESLKWATYYSALAVTLEGTIPSYRYEKEVEEFIKSFE